jgi:hypothetical protein
VVVLVAATKLIIERKLAAVVALVGKITLPLYPVLLIRWL